MVMIDIWKQKVLVFYKWDMEMNKIRKIFREEWDMEMGQTGKTVLETNIF